MKVEGMSIRGSPFAVVARLSIQKLGTPIRTVGGVKYPWSLAVNQRREIIVAENSGHALHLHLQSKWREDQNIWE